MALTGDLSELDLKSILNLIASLKSTGKLEIIGDSMHLGLYFKDGIIVDADGDKDAISSFEKAAGLTSGKFELIKMDSVKESEKAKELQALATDLDSILKRWERLRKVFPNYDIVFDIGEAKSEEVKLSTDEWKILAIIREPTTLLRLLINSPYGEMKTLELLASLFDKGLITMNFESEDVVKAEDEVIPVKETGWYAMRSPIYGDRNIAFYNKIDGRKDFVTICREMGITLREGRQILRYLLNNDKITLKSKTNR
jgi:hypothetical protein